MAVLSFAISSPALPQRSKFLRNSSKKIHSVIKCTKSESVSEETRKSKRLSDQSSWEAKDSQGKDYLYRLGNEADNVNVTVGAKAGAIDPLFAGTFLGKDSDIVFDYRQKVTRSFEYIQGDYYIAPVFLFYADYNTYTGQILVACHIVKNYIAHLLNNVKVPLILGVWGGKGQGKSFQTELIFQTMGIEPVIMSAGELESERAGEPGRLIRERYRTASQVVQNQGKMSCLMINDIDAGLGRFGNTQMTPTREDIVNIVHRMYEKDVISRDDVVSIVNTFPNQGNFLENNNHQGIIFLENYLSAVARAVASFSGLYASFSSLDLL
ncbi:hypothetical protein ACFE04_005954 [Oxalis oulophora]